MSSLATGKYTWCLLKLFTTFKFPFIFLVAQALEFFKTLFSELRYNFRKEI